MTWTEIIVSAFLLCGTLFILIGSLGVLNMPNALTRAHAISKAMTLGIILLLIGLWGKLGTEEVGLKAFLGICFQLSTIPLSSHLMALWYKSYQDNR